jgi:hypothetical protein
MTRIIAALIVMGVTVAHAEPQTVVRDAAGRTVGTATRDSGGTVTFRDAGGRTTGTATRDSGGMSRLRAAPKLKAKPPGPSRWGF